MRSLVRPRRVEECVLPASSCLKDHSVILKGAFRSALRTALDEVIAGHELGSESRMTRGWKLFLLLPRLLLHRPSRGSHCGRGGASQ